MRDILSSLRLHAGSLNAHWTFAIVGGGVALFLSRFLFEIGVDAGAAFAAVATASAAVMWCVVDSMRRASYWDRSAQWSTFFFWPIAVPVYLYKSRGKPGIWIGLVFFVTMVAVQSCGVGSARVAFGEAP